MKIEGHRDFLPVNIAVLTVSDTRSEADDRSGNTLIERLQAATPSPPAPSCATRPS